MAIMTRCSGPPTFHEDSYRYVALAQNPHLPVEVDGSLARFNGAF